MLKIQIILKIAEICFYKIAVAGPQVLPKAQNNEITTTTPTYSDGKNQFILLV